MRFSHVFLITLIRKHMVLKCLKELLKHVRAHAFLITLIRKHMVLICLKEHMSLFKGEVVVTPTTQFVEIFYPRATR
jgi:hypothetical protein